MNEKQDVINWIKNKAELENFSIEHPQELELQIKYASDEYIRNLINNIMYCWDNTFIVEIGYTSSVHHPTTYIKFILNDGEERSINLFRDCRDYFRNLETEMS